MKACVKLGYLHGPQANKIRALARDPYEPGRDGVFQVFRKMV